MADTGTSEVVVEASTGGRKGSKPEQLAWLPPEGLRALGRVAGHGADKYEDPHNYRLGYAHSLSSNAALRHLIDYLDGKDVDADSGCHPLAHAAWHCLNIIQQQHDHPELDDRFKAQAEKTKHELAEAFKKTVAVSPQTGGFTGTIKDYPRMNMAKGGWQSGW